jgi:hypothetical protein
MWQILGTPKATGDWLVRAEPGLGAGDFQAYNTEPFETSLALRGGKLVAGSGDDLSKTLVFRPAVPVPPAARAVLEDTVQRMEGGECLKVMSRLATRPDAAAQMCALRAKMSQFLGSYLSMSVDSMTEFDRVPDGFPVKPSTGWRRQRGVFFVFTGRYENQVIPGNAVVFEEAGEWRVVLLWF